MSLARSAIRALRCTAVPLVDTASSLRTTMYWLGTAFSSLLNFAGGASGEVGGRGRDVREGANCGGYPGNGYV